MTNSDHDLRRETQTTSAVMDDRSLYEFGSRDKEELRSEARERRKSVNRVSELRTGGSYQLGVPFFCFIFSLLFSILHYFFGSRPGINVVGTGFTTSGSHNGRWSFPVPRIRRKVTLTGTDRLWELRVRTIAYVERLFDYSLSFSSIVLAFAAQEVCA